MLPAGNLIQVTGRQHHRCIIPQLVNTVCAPEDGRNFRLKHVELIGIINKPLLLHLVCCLYYCISDAWSYKHQMLVICLEWGICSSDKHRWLGVTVFHCLHCLLCLNQWICSLKKQSTNILEYWNKIVISKLSDAIILEHCQTWYDDTFPLSSSAVNWMAALRHIANL